jgi:hypothetical protein
VFTRADKILIVILIVVSAAGYPLIKYFFQGGAYLEISVEGQVKETVSMDRYTDITVQGRKGISVIHIDETGARFTQSPCVDKKCIESAPVKDAGEISACIPNRVMIRVLGDNNISTDFISR